MKAKELLYGKGQGGKGRGMMQEVNLPTTPPKDKKPAEQPYKMGTTTAKASWRK